MRNCITKGCSHHDYYDDNENTTGKEKNGKYYEYEGGELKRECDYKNGRKIRVLREWNDNVMIEYNMNGIREYEGGYEEDTKNGFVREGKGTEFRGDGKSAVYVGGWKKGKKHGYGEELDENGVVIRRGRWRYGVYGVRLRPGSDSSVFDRDCVERVQHLDIGNECLPMVNRFVMDGLSELRSIFIGRRALDSMETREGSEFVVKNCDQLSEIMIGNDAMCYFESFACKNLPSLVSLRLGANILKYCHSVVLESSTFIGC